MFNRTNYSNPFSSSRSGGPPSREGYSVPGQGPPPSYGQPLPGAGYSVAPPGYAEAELTDVHGDFRGRPGQMPMPSKPPVGAKPPAGGGNWILKPAKSPDNNYTFGNL